MEATVFNPIQQHLLMMFAYDSNEEHLKEMKAICAKKLANITSICRSVDKLGL